MTINPLYDISRVYLEQVVESHVPGKPAEKLGAVTAIPKDEQEAARQRTLAKAKAMREKKGIKEAAKPDYLDFDKDGNEKESMKKALKDKAKQKVEEAKKPNDGNLANNYPPYDKVTRGDVIAGATGKDQMGGKKKKVKEGYSNWREDLKEVLDSDSQDQNLEKVEEKKGIKNKVIINPEMKEAVEQLGGQLIEMVELDEKTLTSAETKKKEEIVKSMKKDLSGFKQRYGERAKEVMYATATKQAKKVAEQAMELQPKTQQKTQSEKPDPALVAKQKQSIALQKQIEMKKLQALSKGVSLTQSEESTADKALAMVKASMGSGLMTGKEKPTKPTAAQKAAAQKASNAYLKRTSDYLHSSPRD